MSKARYTEEFKKEAVKLVLEKNYTRAQACRSLGMSTSTFAEWMKRYRGDISVSGETDGMRLARLEQENKRLRMERDILKKAATFFAKESE